MATINVEQLKNEKTLDEWNPPIPGNKPNYNEMYKLIKINLMQDVGDKLIAAMSELQASESWDEHLESTMQILAVALGELREFSINNCIPMEICQHRKSCYDEALAYPDE